MKHYSELSADKVAARVRSMVAIRKNYIETGTDGLTVRFSTGNRKTGANVPSVSLIPVADCGNCKVCSGGCYDVRNVCFQKSVQISRAVNSAILKSNPEKYFAAVRKFVRFARFFRWHVGGDLVNLDYFLQVVAIALETPQCEFLIFTKEFDLVNGWLSDGNKLPKVNAIGNLNPGFLIKLTGSSFIDGFLAGFQESARNGPVVFVRMSSTLN